MAARLDPKSLIGAGGGADDPMLQIQRRHKSQHYQSYQVVGYLRKVAVRVLLQLQS